MADSINLKFPKDFFKDYARGKPCMVRIARDCGHGGCSHQDTVVLAHLTMPGLKGIGAKLPDLLGAWACNTCHNLLDGRLAPTQNAPLFYHWPQERSKDWLVLMHHEAVARTIDQLVKDGVLPNP